MRLQTYRDVVALRDARSVLALGFLVRLPMFALGIVLTLHVVSTLGRSYGEAGLVSAAFTIALAVSAPWRGRLLDRYGLRRTLMPSIVVTSLLWTSLPFVSYAVLLPASVVAGVFAIAAGGKVVRSHREHLTTWKTLGLPAPLVWTFGATNGACLLYTSPSPRD